MAEPALETSSAPLGVCVGWGGRSVCERWGRPVCFGGLAVAGLLGNLSQLLAGAVWACRGSGSHQQSETGLHSIQQTCRDPGTQGQAGSGGQGRVGLGGTGPVLRVPIRGLGGPLGEALEEDPGWGFSGRHLDCVLDISSWLGLEVYTLHLTRGSLQVQEG